MTILERFRAFTSPSTSPVPAAAPRAERSEIRLLRLLGATSFASLERAAELKAASGFAPGRMLERRNAEGRLCDVRPKSYPSLLEAAIDGKLAALEDHERDCERDLQRLADSRSLAHPADLAPAQAALENAATRLRECRRLVPLAGRWRILRDLEALGVMERSENAPQALKTNVSAPEPRGAGSVLADSTGDAYHDNLRDVRAQTMLTIQANRDRNAERIQTRMQIRNEAALRVPNLADTSGEFARLHLALRSWNEANPRLAEELSRVAE